MSTSDILVGRNGTCEIAPVGTALPDDIDDTLNVAFVDCGEISEDGLEHAFKVDSTQIKNWKGAAVRVLNTSAEATFKLKFLETNSQVIGLYYGQDVESQSGDLSRVLLGAPDPDPRVMVVTVVDGDVVKRYVLAQVQATDRGDVAEKGDEAGYELTFTALYDGTIGGFGYVQFATDLNDAS